MNVAAQNYDGDYVPAIPEPFYIGGWRFWVRCKCKCKREFRDKEQYRGHYALVHILKI